MPSEQTRKTERLAWNVIDKYIKDNPKPRTSARTRHRMKMWLTSAISQRHMIKEAPEDFVMPLSEDDVYSMMDFARRIED